MNEKWCVMDNECYVVGEETYSTVDELFNNFLGNYTIDEMKENDFTICKVLCEGNCWVECLEQYQPDEI